MTAEQTFRIASIPADGVGAEVVAAGRAVLAALETAPAGRFSFAWTEFPWGSDYYAEHGVMMPGDGLELLREFDAIYFGAVGRPTVPDHMSLWGLRLKICQGFDQWANVRPVTFLPGITSPLRTAGETELDWIVVRENSAGEYAGFGGRNFTARAAGGEVAVQSAVFTESMLVDAMSAKFVLQPQDLSVVVASNLSADILSDLGSALAGSLGLAVSANLNPERRYPSMFEPVHGSAPDIAGQGRCNPIGSAALMLEHFGLPDEATSIRTAIETTTAQGIRTPDVGGTADTAAVRTSARSSRIDP
ncbi:tartrate dehydrogenase [Amycolatopsis ultiminotia]|uniref:Tartrate dehydrogenase n=1 Tax=Amycolatopsis ultiminotia TaxID=543629 RepID=A0ABP6V5Q5_9PSEU